MALKDQLESGKDGLSGEKPFHEQLETPEEKKKRVMSLYIVHTCMLIFSLGYSIVLTGVLPYLRRLTSLDNKELMELFGWMVAINPIGQMLFSLPLGWLTSRMGSIRMTCIITCLLYVVGNIIYACLSLLPDEHEGWYRAGVMLFGRLLVGIGTANQAPIRAYIAGATFTHERSFHISILSLFQTIGFMIGPAIQAALTPVGCSLAYESGSLHLDMYTITGWLSAFVGFISMVSFMPGIFSEHYVSKKEAAQINKDNKTNEDILSVKPDIWAVSALVFCFFVFLLNFILLETIGTPLAMQQLQWTESQAIRNLGIIMSCGAVASLLCYGSIPPLTKKFDERKVYLILGLLPMFLARIVMMPIPNEPTPQMLYTELNTTFNASSYASDTVTLFGPGLRNHDCSDTNSTEPPGCAYKWCEYTPAIKEVQFYLSYAVNSLSFPYCISICQAMFRSELITPRRNVSPQRFMIAARLSGPDRREHGWGY